MGHIQNSQPLVPYQTFGWLLQLHLCVQQFDTDSPLHVGGGEQDRRYELR